MRARSQCACYRSVVHTLRLYAFDVPMPKKPKRARTVRRETLREAVSFARDRERLFALEPGGSPERPIEVDAVSVIELRAVAVACPRCDGEHRVEEHAAVTTRSGGRLREVRLVCRACAARRSLWFRLPVLN
jgi:transposase-like protein